MTYRVPSGLAAMVGAGLLAGLAPASSAAGVWLLAGIALAALLAVAYGQSTMDLTAPLPYAFGVLGRMAGASAIAGTFGDYLLPEHPLPAAVALIAVATVASFVRPSRTLVVAGAAVVLAVLVIFVVACFAITPAEQTITLPGTNDLAGLPLATLLMFFGFLGFERGSGPLTVGLALVIYLAVAGAALYQLGGTRLALSTTPLRDALAAADASGIDTVLTAGAALACLLALSGLLTDVRQGQRGVVLTPVVGVAAVAGSALLTVPLAMEVATGLMLGHYTLGWLTSRSGRIRTPPR